MGEGANHDFPDRGDMQQLVGVYTLVSSVNYYNCYYSC